MDLCVLWTALYCRNALLTVLDFVHRLNEKNFTLSSKMRTKETELLLGRIACRPTQCIDAAYCYRCNVVCVCVCVRLVTAVTTVSCAKTDEPIEMLFGVWTWVGLRNYTFGGARIPQGEGQFLGEHFSAQ